jgi:hypothetical protein
MDNGYAQRPGPVPPQPAAAPGTPDALQRMHAMTAAFEDVMIAEPERIHTGLVSFNDFLQQAGVKHVSNIASSSAMINIP